MERADPAAHSAGDRCKRRRRPSDGQLCAGAHCKEAGRKPKNDPAVLGSVFALFCDR